MAATETSRASGTRAKRQAERGSGRGTLLFFVFMLTYFAIYVLMFCTIGTTLLGMGLLSVALLLTVSSYLSGA